MTDDRRAVLVAATDPDAGAEYRSWLPSEYRVETTTDGDDALSRLEDVDAVLVARRLRTGDGTVVARAIERLGAAHTMAVLHEDADSDCDRTEGIRLVGPVSRSAVRETVDRLLRRARYDELMDECATLAARCSALEAEERDGAVDAADAASQRRLAELLSEVDDLIERFDGEDFQAAFGTCTYGGRTRPQGVRERS